MDILCAEAAEKYLDSIGFRSFIEWITAETLLSRPKDPLEFIATLLRSKIGQRAHNEHYESEQAVTYLRQCYNSASEWTDEHGRITTNRHESGTAASRTVGNSADHALTARAAHLERVIVSFRNIAINMQSLDKVVSSTSKETRKLLNAEEALLFVREESSKTLVGERLDTMKRVYVPIGQGITGIVADTGKIMNVRDAFDHSLFEMEFDQHAEIQTRTMLCVPVKDSSGFVIGVLQVLNKKASAESEAFNDFDEEIAMSISFYVSIAISHAEVFTKATLSLSRLHAMMALMDAMYREQDLYLAMQNIVEQIPDCLSVQRCDVYVLNQEDEMWAIKHGERVQIQQTVGLKRVLRERVRVRLDDGSLAVPIQGQQGDVKAILILQLLDGATALTDEEHELLNMFLSFAEPVLQHITSQEEDIQRRTRILQSD